MSSQGCPWHDRTMSSQGCPWHDRTMSSQGCPWHEIDEEFRMKYKSEDKQFCEPYS
jgi:hypothetical protein